MGYVTGLDTEGSSVAIALSVPKAGSRRIVCHVANATGSPSSLTVRARNPETGRVHGSTVLQVPSASAWTVWRSVPVTLGMAAGTNLVVCSVDSSDQGGVNLDYLTLA
jgi:hypothetical protein